MKNYEELIEQANQAATNGEIERSLDLYKKAIEIEPERVDAYYNLALLCHQQGQIDEAIVNFEKVAELDPNDASVLNNLGVLYYFQNNLQESEKWLKMAIELKPEYVDAIYGLGNVYQKLGRMEKAIQKFYQCLDAEPGYEKATEKLRTLPQQIDKLQIQDVDDKGSIDGENIAVLEFFYHWNYFITTVEVLKKRHNVFLIIGDSFTKSLMQNYNFNIDNFKHIILKNIDWKAINKFLEENQISKLFIPTIQGYEYTYMFSKSIPSVPFYFLIHNFDLWLGHRPILPGSRDKNELLAQVNRVYAHCCREIIQKSAGILSIDKSLRDNVAPLLSGKKVYVTPWNVNEKLISMNELPDNDGEVVFTIPASIDRGRRNYGVALETFKHLARKYDNIKLVLLGRPIGDYGQKVIEQSRSINRKYGREVVRYFEGYIHQNIYDEQLRNSDYFILPLANLNIFGKYKASAAMYDAMVHGRPIFIPERMSFSKDYCMNFGEGFIVYKDLMPTIEEVLSMKSDEKEKLYKAAIQNANFFYIENQVELINRQIFGCSTSC